MDIQDYNELARLTDEMEVILYKMEDLIPDGVHGRPIAERVLGIMDAWKELGNYLDLIGRNPKDIKNLNRKE